MATTFPFRPLPECPARTVGEPLNDYASRLFKFFLDTNCTATLSEEQLDLAEKVGTAVMAGLPRGELVGSDVVLAQRITGARTAIQLVLKARHAWAQEREARKPTQQYPQGGTNPGRLAPLVAPTPTRPPQGVSFDF